MYINVCYEIMRIDNNNNNNNKQNKNTYIYVKNLKWEKLLAEEKKIHYVKKLV